LGATGWQLKSGVGDVQQLEGEILAIVVDVVLRKTREKIHTQNIFWCMGGMKNPRAIFQGENSGVRFCGQRHPIGGK